MSTASDTPRSFSNIAVIGAGAMGHSIAYLFAAAGRDVRLHDKDEGVLAHALQGVRDICALLDTPVNIADRIHATTSLGDAVSSADLAIEAATETLDVKQSIFESIEAHAPQHCLFASNTSGIPIRKIAGALQRPGRLLGTHFWNPPHAVRLVEVVQTSMSRLADVEAVIDTLHNIGMVPVHVRHDIPGCIGNRLQHALKREAIALVAAGVCDAETIDTVCKFGFGSRLAVLGPLEQSDLVGLDLTEKILANILPDLDTTAEVPEYLRALIAEGHLGMKTGRGFRCWTPETAAAVKKRVQEHLLATVRERTPDAS